MATPNLSNHPTITKWDQYTVYQNQLLALIEQNTKTWSSVNNARANVRIKCRGEPARVLLQPSTCALMQEVLGSITSQDINDGVDACRQILLGAPVKDGKHDDEEAEWINTQIERLDKVIDTESVKIQKYISVMKDGIAEGEAELLHYKKIQHALERLSSWVQ